MAAARAAYVQVLTWWHEADPDHCAGECFRAASIDAALSIPTAPPRTQTPVKPAHPDSPVSSTALDEALDAAARAIYDLNPARAPHDGEPFGYTATHPLARDRQDLARRQAAAAATALRSAAP